MPDARPTGPEAANPLPPRSFRTRRLAPAVAAAVLAAALILALALLWAGGSSLTGLFLTQAEDSPAAADIEVDAAAFKDYFIVDGPAYSPDGRALVLTLRRAKGFPLKDPDYERIAEGTTRPGPLLALQRIAEGYVRCEFFTKANDFLGFTLERIEGLKQRDAIELPLPIARFKGAQRIVIRY